MSTLNYTSVPGATSLYQLSGVTPANNTYCWSGYLAGSGSSLKPTATLEEVWVDLLGTYIFLPAEPKDAATFSTNLAKFLTGQAARFLWIENPDDPVGAWKNWFATATFQSGNNSWGISSPCNFCINNSYHLLINSGCEVLLNTTAGNEAFIFLKDSINFKSQNYLYPSQNDLTIPLNNETLGTFLFEIELINGWKTEGDMTILGVKLCYSTPDPDSLNNSTMALDMPILRQSNAAIINMSLSIDLLNPMVADRTSLSFIPSDAGNYPIFYSSLSTTKGYSINLSPTVATASLWPGRLAFGKSPLYSDGSAGEDDFAYHLSPDGLFTITVKPPVGAPTIGNQFMLGISGTESVALPDTEGGLIMVVGISGTEPFAFLPDTEGGLIFYKAGQPAYMPVSSDGSLTAPTSDGTTSYATILPSTVAADGLTYYAQPIQAPLFQASSAEKLDYHQMPGGTLPTLESAGPTTMVMPIGAYKWVDSNRLDLVRTFEETVFAKARRTAIAVPIGGEGPGFKAMAKTKPKVLAVPANPDLAVTPNGLVAKLTADKKFWSGVVIGNMEESLHKEVQLTEVKPGLQKGLQANQLFFVVSNVDAFMEQSSIQYRLTTDDISLLEAEGLPADFITTLTTAYGTLPTNVYDDETAFLVSYPPDNGSDNDYAAHKAAVLAVAGLLITDMDHWTFQLSPRSWRTDPKNPTIMLFKFCNRPLTALIQDSHSWGWQEAAYDGNNSVDTTQGNLQDIVSYAKGRSQTEPADDPYAIFYNEVLNNPMWNGVLFLNAPIDFTEMPPELEFLSAGIDQSQFYAHHIGFSVTPFTPTASGIELKQTAAFGLINYEDSVDMVASSTIPFGFKTMQLQVRFANAHIATFAAQVELMLNDLFGAPLMKQNPTRGNNLIMIGSYQKTGGTPSYSFSLSGENKFNVQKAALIGVEILSVIIKTGGGSNPDNIVTKFALSGNMRFANLPDFDLFSFGPDSITGADGYLRFGGIDVTMSFDKFRPEVQTFTVDPGATSFDLVNSMVRGLSLVDNFPLIISHLVVSPNLAKQGDPPSGQSPEDMGFTSISCPLDQTPMPAGWTGLVFNLDLGTLGALAGSTGLTVSFLAAWMPGSAPGDMPVYLGLKLPSIPAVGGSIPIQGILKIGFRSFEFSTYPAENDQLGYILTLHRFALSVLCFSFPPGNNFLQIFGAPGDTKSSVGWFAAYAKDSGGDGTSSSLLLADGTTNLPQVSPKTITDPVARRLQSGRRTPLAE